MPRRTLFTTLALFAVVALAVAGCGSSKSKSKSKSASKSTATSSTTVPLHPGNNTSLRHNIVESKCAAASGGWEAGGTALNPTKKSITYTLTVYFANAEGTIEATGHATVPVKAGKTAEWSASATIASPDPKTTCVLSGVAA